MNKINYKILGLDYGDKKIGIAIADSENKLALPYKIIDNNNFINQLKGICEKESIGKIIVGLPLALSGKDTEQTKKVKNIIKILKEEFVFPIGLEDERMTSKLAGVMVGNKKDDVSAAAIILQSYLDRQNK